MDEPSCKEFKYAWDRPKHAEFDSYWEANNGLVWFMAHRLANKFETTAQELVGSLTILFNHCLYTYNPERAKLSTFFCRSCYRFVMLYWMRHESQSWDDFVKHMGSTTEEESLSERNFASHEVDFHLYRVPEEDESDVNMVIDSFDSAQECWDFMVRATDGTDRQMLELHFRDGWTYQAIGDKFSVSKERVRQRIDRAMLSVRRRIQTMTTFLYLFK